VFNRVLNPDFLWELGYVTPVWLAMLGGAVALYLNRRRAPGAWRLGAFTLLGLLAFEAASVTVSEWLVYEVTKGSTIPLLVWKLRLMAIASSLAHAAAFALLTAAVLIGRRAPAPAGDEPAG
jgi:hypothetical protein